MEQYKSKSRNSKFDKPAHSKLGVFINFTGEDGKRMYEEDDIAQAIDVVEAKHGLKLRYGRDKRDMVYVVLPMD